MSRLTKKKWHQLCGRKKDWFEYVPNKYTSVDRIYKLGQLEDIEEELGIDLITFIRIIKMLCKDADNKIYVKFLDCVDEINIVCPELNLEDRCIVEHYHPDAPCDNYYYFKDYAKKWALTSEELR